MKSGYFRVGCVSPNVKAGDVAYNREQLAKMILEVAGRGANLVLAPELAMTGTGLDDLYLSRNLEREALTELLKLAQSTASVNSLLVIGLPLSSPCGLHKASALLYKGEILKFVVTQTLKKTEKQWFSPLPANDTSRDASGYGGNYETPYFIVVDGSEIPLYPDDIVFRLSSPDQDWDGDIAFPYEDDDLDDDKLSPEENSASNCDADEKSLGANNYINFSLLSIGNLETPDALWARRGETHVDLYLLPAAFPETYNTRDIISVSLKALSMKNKSAIAMCNAGFWGSTAEEVGSGRIFVVENGKIIAHSSPLSVNTNIVDIDINYLRYLFRRDSDTSGMRAAALPAEIWVDKFAESDEIIRYLRPYPFLGAPQCAIAPRKALKVLDIQAHGLAARMRYMDADKVVIGISGGLDSTLALLVCARAFDKVGLPRNGIKAISLPGLGTSEKTRHNAKLLAEYVGAEFREISIAEAVRGHLKAIGHDGETGDIAFENAQARERTQILMDIANIEGAPVIGTGDLSEIALGWSTYNGDHISMYNVNAGVPKTVILAMLTCFSHNPVFPAVPTRNIADPAEQNILTTLSENKDLAEILADIVATPISPELLPPDENGQIAQKTELVVGPYPLVDFFLWYLVGRGATPTQVWQLAKQVWADKYSEADILKYIRVFIHRFFRYQFKRTASAEGPKVFDLSLSPRAGWRMPGDASAATWLREVEELEQNLREA